MKCLVSVVLNNIQQLFANFPNNFHFRLSSLSLSQQWPQSQAMAMGIVMEGTMARGRPSPATDMVMEDTVARGLLWLSPATVTMARGQLRLSLATAIVMVTEDTTARGPLRLSPAMATMGTMARGRLRLAMVDTTARGLLRLNQAMVIAMATATMDEDATLPKYMHFVIN